MGKKAPSLFWFVLGVSLALSPASINLQLCVSGWIAQLLPVSFLIFVKEDGLMHVSGRRRNGAGAWDTGQAQAIMHIFNSEYILAYDNPRENFILQLK